MTIEFSDELQLAAAIADRYECIMLAKTSPIPGYDRMSLMMDILAADGKNGNLPIDLAGLLAAKDGDFMHDVMGINSRMDRKTGVLTDCFVPRYARYDPDA